MKIISHYLLSLCLLIVISTSLSAQEKGNYNRSKGNYAKLAGNNTYEALNQYNSDDKKALTEAYLNTSSFNPNTDKILVFKVNALYNKKADSYLAIFGLVQLAQTAEEADQLLNERYNNFVAAANQLGIPKEDIFLDMVSFVPIFEYQTEKKLFGKNYQEVPKGFEVQQNLHVKFKDSKILTQIISAAAKQQIYDLVTVEHFVKDPDKIYEELRQKAIQQVNNKVSSAKQLGINLDSAYRTFAEDRAVAYPPDRYVSYQAFCSASLDAKKNADVKQIRKPVTAFYNKVPYENYDIVVNPEFTNPAVQYSYSITVKFVLDDLAKPKEKVKLQKEYYLVTPNGEIKPLPTR